MKKRGFTLIELAIVLTIIGLLVGGSFKALKMMRERAKTQEAKEQVLAAKNAVLGFALKEHFLPYSSEFDDNLSSSKDPNHPLFYAADTNIQNDDICAYDTTALQVINKGTTINKVAFVIAHEGANYNLQTGLSGNSVTIYDPSVKADDNATYMNNNQHEFDDIVEWVTLEQLKDEVGCLDKHFRFINDKLPNATQYRDYNATLYVENNISSVTISCIPTPQKGISFSDPSFSGTPTESGVAKFSCSATVAGSNQSAQKDFTITIDPNLKDYNTTCTNGSECQSGICIGGLCQAGVIQDSCGSNSDCQSGFCAGGVCTTGAFDAACDDGEDCKSGICVGGLCSGYLGGGCIGHADCLSGYCDSNNTCAIMPSGGGSGGDDDNGSGGGGGGGGVPTTYTISSISNGSYTLNGGSCKTGVTTDVASGTFMEVFKFGGCDNWWLQTSGLVQDLDTNGNTVVNCNSGGHCD